MVNPFQAPTNVNEPIAEVTVLRRDRIGLRVTQQIYRFESRLSVEQQLELVVEFFTNRGGMRFQYGDRSVSFSRGRPGWRQWFVTRETEITQWDQVRVGPSPDRPGLTRCEIGYELRAPLQLYVPTHHLEVEVRKIAELSANAASWSCGILKMEASDDRESAEIPAPQIPYPETAIDADHDRASR